MENANKVLLESSDEYNVNLADGGEAFISSMDDDISGADSKDAAFIRTKVLPKPQLVGRNKKIKAKQKLNQAFFSGFIPKLFGRNKIKTTGVQLDSAELNTKSNAKDRPSKTAPKDDGNYIYNLKQYDQKEKLVENKDSYYTVKRAADGTAIVDEAYGYSEKTDSFNSVSDYIDPYSPAVKKLLAGISGLNDGSVSLEDKVVKLYNYIVNNFKYVPDASDSWNFVEETIANKSGDCEDLTNLLASALIALLRQEGLSYEEANGRVAAIAGSDPLYGDHVYVEYQDENGQSYILDPAFANGKNIGALSELTQTKQNNFTVYFSYNDTQIKGEALADVSAAGNAVTFRSAAGVPEHIYVVNSTVKSNFKLTDIQAAKIEEYANNGDWNGLAVHLETIALAQSIIRDKYPSNSVQYQEYNANVNALNELARMSRTNPAALVANGFLADNGTAAGGNTGGATTIPPDGTDPPPPANRAPTAYAGTDRLVDLSKGNTVTLEGSGYDPDNDALTYKWEQISGPSTCAIGNSSSPTANISGLQAGNYKFKLTVTDSNGATHTDEVLVVVSNPPEVYAGEDIVVRLSEGNTATLRGNAVDPDGDYISYKWKQLSGPNTCAIANSGLSSTEISNLQMGIYTFELTVTDAHGLTSTATVRVIVEETAPPTEQSPYKPELDAEILGTIINEDVTEALITLSYDEEFIEEYQAWVLKGAGDEQPAASFLFLTSDFKAELERCVTQDDKAALDQCIDKILVWLDAMETRYNQNNLYVSALENIRSTKTLLREWKNRPMSTVKQFFKTVDSPFLIMRTDKFDEYKERILFAANLQKLITMLTQAKGDSRNAIQQIMIEQSGYQKMNIEKLNDKQTQSLTNYVNTRMKEISDYVNNHNKIAESTMKKAIEEQRKQEHADLWTLLIGGIVSFLASVLFGVVGISFAPVALSVVTTITTVVQSIRSSRIEINALKQQENIEEQLMLLHTSQKQMDSISLQKKAAELRKHQQELEDKQAEKQALEQKLKENIEIKKQELAGLESAGKENTEEWLRAQDELADLQTELQNAQEQITSGQKYLDVLDLELMQQNITAQNSALEHNNGYLEFDNTLYAQNSLRVQALVNALRLIEMVQKSQHQGRDNVAAELSLPGAVTSKYAENVVNQKATELVEKMNVLGQKEIQIADAYNQRKEAEEQIKQLNFNTGFGIMSKMFFGVIDIMTFGTGGTVLGALFRSTGEAAFGYYGKYTAKTNAVYNPNAAANFQGQSQNSTDFYAVYSSALTNSSAMLRDLTENKKTLDYEKYLQLMEEIKWTQIEKELEIALNAAQKNSRNVVHQELTDIKTDTQSATVKIVAKQDLALLQDIVQKQAYLANIQAQAINKRVDMQVELDKAGYNILASVFSGLLAGQSQIAKSGDNLNDAFIYSQVNNLFGQNKDNIFNLIIGDSDLKLQAENQKNPNNGGLSAGLSGFKSPELWVEDDRGNVTVDQRVFLKKYAKLQRQLIMEQALAALQSARQKARDIVHTELAEKTAPTAGLTAALTAINKETALQEWNILTEQVYSIADLQTKRNFAATEMQRSFTTSILSTTFASMGYACGLNMDQANAVGQLTTISSEVLYLLKDINDTMLDAVNRLTAEDLTAGELAEELGFNRLTEAEEKLLLEALNYKNNVSEYGFAVEDKAQLEYINTIIDRLHKLKEQLLNVRAEFSEGRGNVHGVLNAAAAETTSFLREFADLHKRFVQQIMDSLKKGASEIIKRQNERQNQRLQLELKCFDYAISALEMTAPFLNDSSSAWLKNFTEALNSFLPLLKAGYLEYVKKGEEEKQALPDLDGLTPAEKMRVQSASAAADLALAETEKSYGFLEQTHKLVEQFIRDISKLTAKAITNGIVKSRLDQLLNSNRLADLHREIAAGESRQEELKAQIAEAFAAMPLDHPFYSTHLQPALELFEAGDYAGALAKLNLEGLDEAAVGQQTYLLKKMLETNIEQLNALNARLPQAKAELAQAERDAADNIKVFRENLDYINKHLPAFQKLQKQVADKEITPEEFAATEEYKNMQTAALALAPLFSDLTEYEKLIQELIPLSTFYGSSTASLLSGLTAAQTLYAQNFAPLAVQEAQAESLQKQGLASGNYHYSPSNNDVAGIWAQFFAKRHEQNKTRGEIEKQNVTARAAVEEAGHDQEVIANLFDAPENAEQEIDIATADISQDLKLYIIEWCGGVKVPPDQRARISEYVEQRKNSREVLALDAEADVEYAAALLAADWVEVESLQKAYNQALAEYLNDQENSETYIQLKIIKMQLEQKEQAFQKKRETFRRQQERNFRLQ
ncbi:MAG: hypothetical protein LBJ25_03240 [Candidatus Margulisbacteria bacterium]|jgi:hypothetical protein|nr:hypothetical protein [Candidatus Margulisiibacteriota bacterium]